MSHKPVKSIDTLSMSQQGADSQRGRVEDVRPSIDTSKVIRHQQLYVPTRVKLGISLILASAWCGLSVYLALPWIDELGQSVTLPVAWLIVAGIALIPGFANAFMMAGLLMDRRPDFSQSMTLPPVSILIAAYNEEQYIEETLLSIQLQKYDAPIQILIIDDGSTDSTVQKANRYIETSLVPNISATVIRHEKNQGKAQALNTGLAHVEYDHVITLDADSYLFKGAIENIVKNLLLGPQNTMAVAGTILARNSRHNWLTRLQEWDYFQGIAVVKRIQSLFQGTLVAQGAFSIYETQALKAVGGWPNTVGEDIVLTWSFIEAGWRVSYAENAFAFTHVPEDYEAYYRQRKRWSRGLIEAFMLHPRVLIKPRMNSPFLYFNLMFPYIDAMFLFCFVPGIILAVFFDIYAIVGVMTLFLLPLALMINIVMYFKQSAIFKRYGLKVRKNVLGVLGYMMFYQLLLSPASLAGYVHEILQTRKEW